MRCNELSIYIDLVISLLKRLFTNFYSVKIILAIAKYNTNKKKVLRKLKFVIDIYDLLSLLKRLAYLLIFVLLREKLSLKTIKIIHFSYVRCNQLSIHIDLLISLLKKLNCLY